MDYRKRYEEYLLTQHWKDLRQAKLKQVGSVCETCGNSWELHVHHIEYRNLIDCTLDDLAVLCKTCHFDAHNIFESTERTLKGVEAFEIGWELVRFYQSEYYRLREALIRINAFEKPLLEAMETFQSSRIRLIAEMHNIHENPNPPPRPDLETITLTRELLQACRTNGSFTTATLNALVPNRSDRNKGCLSGLIGAQMPKEQYEKALAGVGVYRRKKPINPPHPQEKDPAV